jgi:hypothetical protein
MITEPEYRLIDVDSYSSLKLFVDDRKKYHKKHVLKEKVKEEVSRELVFGDLVDTMLLLPYERLNEKFEISTIGELDKDANQMNFFAVKLWELTIRYLDEDNSITQDFTVLAEEAFELSKYDRQGNEVRFKKKEFADILLKFEGSEQEHWYNQKRKTFGKTLVSFSEMEFAENVVKELRKNFATKKIINLVSDNRYDVHNQLGIVFKYKDVQLKCLLDKLIVDHTEKKIYPYDLKTTWDVEGFLYNFLKYRYYIQGGIYTLGVSQWMIDEGWTNYTLMPFSFIVTCSSNYMNPLIYETDRKDFQNALDGFTHEGRYYKGINQIVEELKWHRETGTWNISMDNFLSSGIVKLKLSA